MWPGPLTHHTKRAHDHVLAVQEMVVFNLGVFYSGGPSAPTRCGRRLVPVTDNSSLYGPNESLIDKMICKL